MYIEKLASQIRNDVLAGLKGYHQNLSMNMEQLEDEIVNCRLAIIEQQFLNGRLPFKDLMVAINCVDVDCESLERCRCYNATGYTQTQHFQIPQVIYNYGKQAIDYIGSTDRQLKFQIITSLSACQELFSTFLLFRSLFRQLCKFIIFQITFQQYFLFSNN